MTRAEYLGYMDRVAQQLSSPVDARRLPEGSVVLPLDDEEVTDAVVRIWRRIGISEASIESQLASVKQEPDRQAENTPAP